MAPTCLAWKRSFKDGWAARVRKLRVIVRHDGVILQGLASTYYAKQLAQHAAMDLADLPIVANEIEVC